MSQPTAARWRRWFQRERPATAAPTVATPATPENALVPVARPRWFRFFQRRPAAAATASPRVTPRWRRLFERQQAAAAASAETPKEAEKIADRAEQKAEARIAREGKLRKAWSDVQVLVRLLRAYARGEYRDVSRGTIALIVGALVYFVAPLDAIFDHLPFAGFVDDAAILAWVVSEVRAELDAFRAWEAKQPQRLLPSPATTSEAAAPPALDPVPSSRSS
jgi:uncharacterized membrane protein YkvA (DUF1232 family)